MIHLDSDQTPSQTRKTTASPAKAFVAARRAARCADVIGAPRECLHVVSDGEWSLHDTIAHLLTLSGPSDVYIATWSISEDAVRKICAMQESGAIKTLTCLCDWRVKQRRPAAAAFLRVRSTKMRVANCHAKAAVIVGGARSFAVVTSANLTNNPRLETYVIDPTDAAVRFHSAWILSAYDCGSPFDDGTRLL